MKSRYSEAVEILYKDNTFDFDYLADVMRLSLVVLPERMRLISDVTWRYGHLVSRLLHLGNYSARMVLTYL